MTGNHWTVFNGAGAVVCDNMPLDAARAYLTPERAERGWVAAYTLVVRDPVDFPAELVAVPIDPPLSLLPHLTNVSSVEHLSERDQGIYMARLRSRWTAILEAASGVPSSDGGQSNG